MNKKYTFRKVLITMTAEERQHQKGAGHYVNTIDGHFFNIVLDGHGDVGLLCQQWMLSSCAAMGLSDLHCVNWPPAAIPDFLKFLETLEHRGGYAPKKYYFLTKVPGTSGYETQFSVDLAKAAKLVDRFKNKAHSSSGDLGLFTLEF